MISSALMPEYVYGACPLNVAAAGWVFKGAGGLCMCVMFGSVSHTIKRRSTIEVHPNILRLLT